jgi:hypothetical protein
MRNYLTVIFRLIAAVGPILVLSGAGAAPPGASQEDRYVATRDAAIAKFSPIYEAGKSDDATTKAEDAAFADLRAQMAAILAEPGRKGFGPARLNIETFYKGDEGFGTLDGLRFDSELGANGEKAGQDGADGKYVEPGGPHHRDDADPVRALAARPQGLVGQGHQERAAADRQGAQG